MILIIRLAVGLSAASEVRRADILPAFTNERGPHRDLRVHKLLWVSPSTQLIGRRVGAWGARSRGGRAYRRWARRIDACHLRAVPAVQRTRNRRVPIFDGVVVRMLFDDDRLAVTPFQDVKMRPPSE